MKLSKKEMFLRDCGIIIDINNIGNVVFEDIFAEEKSCVVMGTHIYYKAIMSYGSYSEVAKMYGLSLDRVRQIYQKHLRKTAHRAKHNSLEYARDYFYTPMLDEYLK